MFRHCSLPFLLSPMLICWGLCVLGISLSTLAVTTSYRGVFPFGAPLWTGSLFLMMGCFLVFAYRPTDKVLALSSKAHVWFTLSVGVIGICECLLALGLSLWYYFIVYPTLSTCTPDHSLSNESGHLRMTCECSEGFINQPSLMRTVYRFEGVSDCTSLGGTLRVFHNLLTSLYALGAILSILLSIGASKSLHSLGVCGESGVYVVTPAPTLEVSTSRPPSPEASSHLSVGTSHYNTSGGVSTLSYRFPNGHYPNTSPVKRTPATSGTVVRTRITSTGSTNHTAMI